MPARRSQAPAPDSSDSPRGARVISASGASIVGVASIVSALSGIVVLAIAARNLSEAQNTEFLLFWSVLFWVFGSLLGLQNEVTRAVRAEALGASTGTRTVKVMPAGMGIGAALAAIVALTGLVWAPAAFEENPWRALTIIAVAALIYGGFVTQAGALSGLGVWNPYSAQVALDALLRLAASGVVALVGASVGGFELAATAGVISWILLAALVPKTRTVDGARADIPLAPFVRHSLQAIGATAASSVLVVGFTMLLRLTTPAAEYKTAAALILAISLTRAPLLIPLGAYQGVVIASFVNNTRAGWALLRRSFGLLTLLGVAVGGLAWLVGPWAIVLVFGAKYQISGAVLAGLCLAAVFLAGITLTGAIALAIGRHSAYVTGWVLATLVSISILLLPWGIDARVVASLVGGPLLGMAVHIWAVRRGNIAAVKKTPVSNAATTTTENE